MRFKKFLSCLLISSLVNSNFIWSMPGKDPALVALEERTQAGWQKFKHLQQRIIEVTGAKEKTGTSNANLKEPMAEMSGPFMGNYLISQEMARTILSIDEVGDIIRENEKGTSPVKCLGNVFFKTDGRHFNPQKPMLSPALENAAYWFYHMMFGEGVTPSCLIAVNKVLIKRPPFSLLQKFGDLFKSYQIVRDNRRDFQYFLQESLKKGVSQETLDEFKNSFEPTYESFIIQASLGVGSEGLDDFIKKMIKEPKKFNELNKRYISIHFLASMLLNLSDAKGDNFRVDNGAIIGIDNDRFFAPDIFRQCSHQEGEHPPYTLCSSAVHRVGARSIFYCSKDVLNMALDESVKVNITSVNPIVSISHWLYQLYCYDNEYNRLKNMGSLDKEWFEVPELEKIDAGTKYMINLNLVSLSSVFPTSLPQRAISPMMHRLNRLISMLKFGRSVNHKAILSGVQPQVMEFYSKVMEREPDINLHEVMGRIYEKYGSYYEGLDLKKYFKDNLMNDISSPRNTATSESLLEGLIKEINLNQYPVKEQVSIINAFGKIYTNLKISKEAFNESWLVEKLPFRLIEQGLSPKGLKLLISIGHEVNQIDEKNQNLVHKVVAYSTVNLAKAESLLETLAHLEANLDLKARGRVENAGTPLSQAMFLEEPGGIAMFNKLIELGAGFDTNYFVAEGFINKNETRLKEDSKFKQRVETLLRRDPKLHWQLSLNKLLPIANDIKAKGVIIKTSGGQERFLSYELEKTMLDNKGNLCNQTTYGRRDVASIKTNGEMYGLYFKSFPELPGVEEQVGRLTRNLLGFGAPHTELVRYKNIPVLLSQAIIGENLQDVLSKNPDILKKLDHKNLSGMILLSILVNPEDGKPDNFIVEPIPGNQYKYRLVCVDNDHAFVPAVAKEQKLNWTRTHDVIQVRSVLYCLDQMNEAIHKDIRDLFIKLDPAEVLKKWLNELKNVHETYGILFNANEMIDYFKKKECFLGVPFKENVVPELYQKFLRLKDAIEENDNITHLDLLMKLEPMLGKRYTQVLSKFMTVKERFDEVEGVFYSKAMSGAHGTVINSKQVLKSMQIPPKRTVIEDLRAGRGYGVLQAIAQLKEAENQQLEKALYNQAVQTGGITAFKNLRIPKVLEEVLEKTDFGKLSTNNEQALIKFLKENKLEQVRSLHLLRSKVIVDGDLRNSILGIGNLTLLDIRGCNNLTQNIFYQISQECPGIRKLLATGIGSKNNPIREISHNKLVGKESINFEYLERLNISDLTELNNIRITGPKLAILEANNCNKFNIIAASHLNFPNLERLELKNNPIIKEEEITDLLINRPKIKYYNLEGCANIENPSKYKDIKTLYNSIFDKLEINYNDKEVKLSSKKYVTIIHVIAVSTLTNLTTLDLSGKMYFSGGNITDEGAKALSSLTNLTTLDLSSNKIGYEGAKALSSLTNLNSLALSDNQIGYEGAKALSSLINLTSLDLGSNKIGDEGAKALSTLTNLTYLDLRFNQIGEEGAKGLSTLTNLTSLALVNNQIGYDSVKALSSLTNLTTLDLHYNTIGKEGAKVLSSLTNLTYIDLRDNQIGYEGAKALSTLTNLTTLHLSYNEIGVEQRWKKLNKMVEQNKAKSPPKEEKKTSEKAQTFRAMQDKKFMQENWSITYNNIPVTLKTLANNAFEINENEFDKIVITKELAIKLIQNNIKFQNVGGRQLQTLLNYYNQANQELSSAIRSINPSITTSKGYTLSQAQSLMPQISTTFIITPEQRKEFESKIKQMQDVMDLLDHYLQNNPDVVKSIVFHTLKHFNQAIYQEDGSFDTNFLDLYSKVSGKPVFIWQEKAVDNAENGLELFYTNDSSDKDPRKGQNFLYNPQDSSLIPLEITK